MLQVFTTYCAFPSVIASFLGLLLPLDETLPPLEDEIERSVNLKQQRGSGDMQALL